MCDPAQPADQRRSALLRWGDDSFEAALAEGQAMTLEQAIEYALAAKTS